MKQRYLLPALLLFLILAACNQEAPPAPETTGPTAATAVTSSVDTVPEPAGSASGYPAPETDAPVADAPGAEELPASSADAVFTGGDSGDEEPVMAANAIPADEITLDPGALPYMPTVLAVDAVPYRVDDMVGPTGLPAHWRIEFTPENEGETAAAAPVLYVIPVEAYRALWAEAGDLGVDGALTALIMTIEAGARPFQDGGVPGLPVEHVGTAFNDLAAQGEYLALENVTGLRFVGRFVQQPVAVSNDGMTYVFLGFSNDGQYLISFFYPIRSETLPASPAAADEATAAALAEDPYGYLSEQAAKLSELGDDAFTPAVSALDALVASLRFGAVDELAAVSEPESNESTVVAGTALGGTAWQWTALEQAGVTTGVADPSRYTVSFGEDGSVDVVAGCLESTGTYATDAASGLAVTLDEPAAACPPMMIDMVLLGGLGNAAAYDMSDATLAITLQYENGTLKFESAAP